MSRRRAAAHHGLLLIDKPAGPTSHDLVQAARRVLGQRQVGHTGTLDPPATGLLPLVLGRATRLARFLPQAPKRYVGTLRLGWTSSTDDAAGELERGAAPLPTDPDEIRRVAESMLGESDQLPPFVSAKRVDGQRLHSLARAGVEVERRPCRVTVHRFELVPTDDPERFEYLAEVSAGTYVRALARDLGETLGCGGHVETLRRTLIGPTDVAAAVPWPAERESAPTLAEVLPSIVPLDRLQLAMPALSLTDSRESARFLLGSAISDSATRPDPAHSGVAPAADSAPLRRVADDAGRLLGVGELVAGVLRPRVVIASAPPAGHSRQTAENA